MQNKLKGGIKMANRYDRERYGFRHEEDEDRFGRERGRGYEDYDRERSYGGRRREERGFWDRASDEVNSWFGDEEAARRRQRDEMESEDTEGSYRDYERRGFGGRGMGGQYGRQSTYGFGRSGQAGTRRTGQSTGEYGHGSYGQGYYGGFGREGRMFGSYGREYERTYRPDVLDYEYPYRSEESYGERRSTEQQSRGRHAGRGPRGYKRSDERILDDVNDRLMRHGDIDATDIEASARDGEVTLSGTVPDRWTKRMAEDVVEDVSGVQNVINLLRVKQEAGQIRGGESILSPQTEQQRMPQEGEQTGRTRSTTTRGS
jgi:osmotically-inducible protein OsmY